MNLVEIQTTRVYYRKGPLLSVFAAMILVTLAAIYSKAVSFNPESPVAVIINAKYPDYDRFVQVASELDIWIVDHETTSFKAMVTEEQYNWLISLGFVITTDEPGMAQLATEPIRSCYRTIDELYTQLAEINQAFPLLTELIPYGNSFEGRPLWVLRISNEANLVHKPRYLVVGGTHGREMITPETAMEFINLLLAGYSSNPDIQMIVDWQETFVIVSANPDGHVRNEVYYSWWRKNTNPNSPCSEGTFGVDLNRNHEFHWGSAGASANPCSEVFRGIAPASEPETVAMQNLVRSLFPDQRGPEITDPAPASTTGILITVHSFAELILWPWGYTHTPAPNSQELEILGRHMAKFNGYTPTQSIDLYPTSGTTDDWAYGELGIAAYTFEIGGPYDGFNPSCSRYDILIQPNLQALLYGAKAAFAPYTLPSGPEISTISLSKAHVKSGEPFSLEATAIELALNGENPISEIQLFVDTPPWAGGTPLTLEPVDGEYDGTQETGSILIAIANISDGQHSLIVQARDNQGNWGVLSTAWFWVGETVFTPLINK